MLLGTFIFSVLRIWLTLVQFILFSSVIKVAFLWFSMAFASSYIFFLLVHKQQVVYVRKALALNVAKSLGIGLLVSSMFIALYEFILQNMMFSKFFAAQQTFIQKSSLIQSNYRDLYIWICCSMIFLSGLFAMYFVGSMLDQWYEELISSRYAWSIFVTTLICWAFLWSVNYVI